MRKRKKIIMIMLFAFFAGIQTLPTVPISATENVILGDVNNDTKVNLLDAQLTLKLALGIEKQTDENKKSADVDQSGDVNLLDAQLVLKKALGVISDFSQKEESHEHNYVWTYVADGDYKVNKCSCGKEAGERAYNLGNGVYGQWKDSMAADLMYWTNIQRGNTVTIPLDGIGNYLTPVVSPALNNTLSNQAKTRAIQCVFDYGHNGMITTDECLAQGYSDAGSVSSAWMASSDHRDAMCDYRYTQGGTACLWYDTDDNGTMSYIWVLVLDRCCH